MAPGRGSRPNRAAPASDRDQNSAATKNEDLRFSACCYCFLVFGAGFVTAVVAPVFDQAVEIAQRASAGDDVGYAITHALVEDDLLSRERRRIETECRVGDGHVGQRFFVFLDVRGVLLRPVWDEQDLWVVGDVLPGSQNLGFAPFS